MLPPFFLINKPFSCHPERSAAKSNCEAAPSKARWDLGRNTLKFHYRSRFAPSLGSGSTTKISHREIFSAQDDTHYVNISGKGENVDFKKYQILFFFSGRGIPSTPTVIRFCIYKKRFSAIPVKEYYAKAFYKITVFFSWITVALFCSGW